MDELDLETQRMEAKEKPECPESKKRRYDYIRLCQLTRNKVCLLESGNICEYYKEWLKEIEIEEG